MDIFSIGRPACESSAVFYCAGRFVVMLNSYPRWSSRRCTSSMLAELYPCSMLTIVVFDTPVASAS